MMKAMTMRRKTRRTKTTEERLLDVAAFHGDDPYDLGYEEDPDLGDR